MPQYLPHINFWENIIGDSPKTTWTGILTAATAIVGALIAQGVTGGPLGTGTYLGFASAALALILGRLAADPK